MPYTNPIIPGTHPDPSICRVGKDYYLCTSTFAYFPAAPIFHSRDLIHWRLLGHALNRPSQLPLAGVSLKNGMYAPTLRHIHGRFYMITTLVNHPEYGSRHLYVWTDDPASEWSDPIWVDQPGIDPDLFQDLDGKIYFIRNNASENETRGILAAGIDLETGQLLTESHFLWTGTGGYEPEGAHLYRIGDWYYLMIAENGTHYGHMETVGRSKNLWGPYDPCPHNPILTHRHLNPYPVKCSGHADLVEDHLGDWWMVFLGVRPLSGWQEFQCLGRESFLAPVTWVDEWPVVNNGEPVGLNMDVATLPLQPWPLAPDLDDFDTPELGSQWLTLRQPNECFYSLTERPGYLRLHGQAANLNSADLCPAFLGCWQKEMVNHFITSLSFEPSGVNEEAGLSTFMSETHHYEITVSRRQNQRVVLLRRRIDDLQTVVAMQEIGDGAVQLICRATPSTYSFSYVVGGGEENFLGTANTKPISVEMAGVFTGMIFALYSSGNGKACTAPADFDYVEIKS